MAAELPRAAAPGLVEATDAPFEARRLFGRWVAEAVERRVPGGPELLGAWETEALRGRRRALLWPGPRDEAIGLAVLGDRGGLGCSASIYLEPEFRVRPAFAEFLGRLRALPAVRPGVVEVREVIGELAAPGVGDALRSEGYREVRRLDMVYPVTKPLFPTSPGAPGPSRALTRDDAPALATLLARAYDDNPEERAVFLRDPDPLEDARRGVAELLSGAFGTPMLAASFVVDVAPGRLAGATVVNDHAGPLITEVVVDPDQRRRGLARALLRATLAALRASDGRSPRLVVTTSNARARRLYERLGFEPVAESEAALWLDELALGIPPGSRPPA